MTISAAMIVKSYLEKYICINLQKTKKRKYPDPTLASNTLTVAFDIVNEMKDLIRSNNADDFTAVKYCLRKQVGIVHHQIKSKQSTFEYFFSKTQLPRDFDQCVNEAWSKLRHLEKFNDEKNKTLTPALSRKR